MTEKPDGSGSVWQPDDAITVSLDGETATYTYDGSAWTSDTPLYWKNTQTAEVTAWYPATDGVVNLSDQDRNGLTYVLRGTGTGNHQSPVTLKFEHQLAKVRVVAKGTAEVRDISIWNVPTICYIEEGKITGQDNSTTGIIPMLSVEREGIGACWEASVGPDVEIKYFSLDGMNCELTSPVTTQAGALHTITITANRRGYAEYPPLDRQHRQQRDRTVTVTLDKEYQIPFANSIRYPWRTVSDTLVRADETT